MLESRVERRLKQGIEALGGLCLKFVSPGKRGAPDRLIIYRGKTYFVETKAPHGQLTPIQKAYHVQLIRAGADVAVLWTIEQVDRYVINLNNELRRA